MDEIIGTWIGPSNESYEFGQELCVITLPGESPITAKYNICGNTLTLGVTYRPEDEEKITLTFSDDGNRVRFDWIDNTKRFKDGVKIICLRRE